MKITDFINGPVTYDKWGGQYFWINDPDGGTQMLAEMRGWGGIQNLCRKKGLSEEEYGAYQDQLGDFIAEAINEKIERLKNKNKIAVVGHHGVMPISVIENLPKIEPFIITRPNIELTSQSFMPKINCKKGHTYIRREEEGDGVIINVIHQCRCGKVL